MHIDESKARGVQYLCRQELPVGDDHAQIRSHRRECFEPLRILEAFGLKHTDPALESKLFDRAGRHVLSAATPAVRLRDNADDDMGRVEQRVE
jgi:hypothetical protein